MSELVLDSETGDVSATSFGGITEANLVDKAATEIITGAWSHSSASFGNFKIKRASTTSAAIKYENNNGILGYAGFIDGGDFRLWDSVIGTIMTIDSAGDIDTTSYGGIAQANLVDKTAVETISGAWNFTAETDFHGVAVNIWDAGLTDYIQINHTGSVANITNVNSTAIQFVDSTATPIRFLGAIASDYTQFGQASATDFRVSPSGSTTDFVFRGGLDVLVQDSTNVENLKLAVTTTEATISSTQHIYLTPGASHDVFIFDSGSTAGLRVYDSTGVDYLRIFDDGSRTTLRNYNNPIAFEPQRTAAGQRQAQMGDGYFYLYNAVQLRIFDSTNADYCGMSHDGTDFNFAFINTNDVNFTGALVYYFDDRVNLGSYLQLATATSTNLNDVTHAINTNTGKIQGAVVYNTTTDNPVYATGSTDAAVWVDGAGTTVNTPV
jgi:hypothetical protein